MANKTMHHVVIGSDTYEIVDEQGRENIAPPFSTSTTYAAGDYVIYSGKLYQFTTAHAGAWTGTDAEEATVTEKLNEGGSGDGLTEDIKQALLQIAEKVAYIDEHGQDYYDALESALYPPADLVSISCVYTQSGTVYDTDTLDSLKDDLVVTAHYSDSTTQTVTDYTLSGTLTEGTSTVTVAYGGKTTTFSVTVTTKGKSDMDGWTDGVAYTDLDIVQNEYCQAITGNFMSYNGWDRTGYVPCDGASTITFPPMPQTDGTPDSNRFFKADKTVYGGRSDNITLSKTESTTITVPSEAYYFVLSSESAALASCISTGIVPHE